MELRARVRWRYLLIIFLWTPPHFWALALNRTDDYARAGVPMLPVVAGKAATTRRILIYSGLLALASSCPGYSEGLAGAVYGVIRRDLRRAFRAAARGPSPQEHRGRSPRRPQAVRVLHLLFVRTVCGFPDRPAMAAVHSRLMRWSHDDRAGRLRCMPNSRPGAVRSARCTGNISGKRGLTCDMVFTCCNPDRCRRTRWLHRRRARSRKGRLPSPSDKFCSTRLGPCWRS